MSKISDYQKALREKEEEDDKQTVGEFAVELMKKPAHLLKQLKEAGVQKSKASDVLTSKDKNQLLKHLQNLLRSEVPRKKITIQVDPETNKLIRRVAEQENGAEYDALNYFLGAVVVGEKIDPDFQKLINVIVAKSVLIGALPMQKLGRPKVEKLDSIGLEAAHLYWRLIDSGVAYDEAVQQVSSEFHKSDRHIMRLIAPHKKTVGETPEKRVANRSWNNMMYEMHMSNPNSFDRYKKIFEPKIPVPEFTDEDCMEHLEEMILELASRAQPLTKKI
jgi:acyl transferase domain-containing protein